MAPDVIPRRSAPVRSTPMSYSVRTPVFEGPFDLLLHLILQAGGGALGGVAGRDRRRLPRRARSHGLVRPRRRHRVPADRRHPGGAQGPPPAPRHRGPRARRGAAALRGARPPPGPAARVQDVQGRRPRPRGPHAQGRPERAPHRRSRGAVPLDGARPAGTGAARRAARRRAAHARGTPDRRRRHRPRGPGARQRARRGGVGPPAPARVRAHELPGAGVGRARTGSR